MTYLTFYKPLAVVVAVSLVAAGVPPRARSQSVSIPRGASTADAAALPVAPARSVSAVSHHAERVADGVLRFGALGQAAEPDSTGEEFDFPDEKKSHLARDITVFVIASAFVAFFLIKVFLEGDTDTPEDSGGGGKPIPQG